MTVTPLNRRLPSTFVESREEGCAEAERLLDSISDPSSPEAERCRHDAVLLSLELADTVAHRYSGRGIEDDDLVQVARMALVKAVRGYRPGRGHSFAAYAVPTMSGEIKRYFRDKGWAVRPPRRLQERRAQLIAAEEMLRHELGREPSRVELADRLGLEPAELGETQACLSAYQTQSLDAASPEGRRAPEIELDGDDEVNRLVQSDALGRALRGLTERERTIVHLRFIEEQTQVEIGTALGVSQMQVSRLLGSILRRLRSSLEQAA
ncbi:sigma-70 family RNA polymerase sigma factor [Knoellia sp. LjRoot47]|uniref:sigma-70 family RNA polymerase sigma factor n=1 Tax=Knoellia sp. LjRoot47 TaxID=3342330 RepID=UPI003ECC8DED